MPSYHDQFLLLSTPRALHRHAIGVAYEFWDERDIQSGDKVKVDMNKG